VPLLVNNPVEQSQTPSEGSYSGCRQHTKRRLPLDFSSSTFASLHHPLDHGTTLVGGWALEKWRRSRGIGTRLSNARRCRRGAVSPSFVLPLFLPSSSTSVTLFYDIPITPLPTTTSQSSFPSLARLTARPEHPSPTSSRLLRRPFAFRCAPCRREGPSDARLVDVMDREGT
jgi:hypothetical protein